MKPIRVSPKLSAPVRKLLLSMLQIDPIQRAGVEEVLNSPLFSKYTSPPFHNPLTVAEYNYLLESYIGNTKGVQHLHLPQELSRLRSMHRMTITSNTFPDKTIGAEGSTQGTITQDGDLPSQLPPLELRDSCRESLSDFLFDPANEACTLFEFPTYQGQQAGGENDARTRDSITLAINLPAGEPFELDSEDSFAHSVFFSVPQDSETRQPWPLLPQESPPPFTDPMSGLNPRIISIKRKQSAGNTDYEDVSLFKLSDF
jgi:serine/threonine protein kinase